MNPPLDTRALSEEAHGLLPLRTRIAMGVAPFLGFGVFCVFVLISKGGAATSFLLAAVGGSFFGIGKFVILAGAAPESPFGVWTLATVVLYCDIGTAVFLLAQMQTLYKTPWLGRRLLALRELGWSVLRSHPWMRRFTWLAVVFWVAAPFQGTGSTLGTVLARLLGFSRVGATTAIGIGSAAGAYGLAVLAHFGRNQLEAMSRDPLIVVISLGFIVVVGIALGRYLTQARHQEQHPPQPPTDPSSG